MTKFAEQMNQKAQELSLENTHFVNANGLHDDNHYSSAYDIAMLYRYAYNNYEDFRRIVGTLNYSVPTSDKYENDDRKFTNTNKLINKSSNYYYDYCTGGKTGYTSQAKNCLVASASKDGVDLICCILGAGQDEKATSYRYSDAASLFDYGFESIKEVTFISKGTVVDSLPVENAKQDQNTVSAVASESLILHIDKDASSSDFETIKEFSGDLIAPIESGEKIGSITYNVYGKTYTIDLVTNKDVEEKPKITIEFILAIIFSIFAVLAIIIVFFRIYNLKRRKRARKQHFSSVRRYNSRFHK